MQNPNLVYELVNLTELVKHIENDALQNPGKLISFTAKNVTNFQVEGQDFSLPTTLEWQEKHEDKYKMNIAEMIIIAIMDSDDEAEDNVENSLYTKYLFSEVITYLPATKSFSLDLFKLIEALEQGGDDDQMDDLELDDLGDDDLLDDEMEGLTAEDLKKKPKDQLN